MWAHTWDCTSSQFAGFAPCGWEGIDPWNDSLGFGPWCRFHYVLLLCTEYIPWFVLYSVQQPFDVCLLVMEVCVSHRKEICNEKRSGGFSWSCVRQRGMIPMMIRRRGDEPGTPMDGSIDWIGLDWTGSDLHSVPQLRFCLLSCYSVLHPEFPLMTIGVLGWCWSLTFTVDLFTWREVWFLCRMLSD